MKLRFNKIIVIVFLVLFIVSCSSFNYSYKKPSEENDGLKIGTINQVGLDSLKLAQAINDITDEKFVNVHSLLISKNNNLVFEEYFNGNKKNTKHQLRSASKSLKSAVIGIAIDKKFLKSVEERVLDLFSYYPIIKNWDKRKDRMKVKHLLTMTAGFDCGNIMDFNSNCGEKMFEKTDPIKYLLDLPMTNEPGEYFSYSDALPFALSAIIRNSTKMSATKFEEKYLHDPLGIKEDPTNFGISAREMMKFGLLYLNKGIWNNQRIISEEWIKESTAIHYKNPNNFMDGYGYYWWQKTFEVNKKKYYTYFAAGNGGQFIFIIPDENLVVVLTGGNYVDFKSSPSLRVSSQPYYILADYILPALSE